MNLLTNNVWLMEPQALNRYAHFLSYPLGDLSDLKAQVDGVASRVQGGVSVIPVQGPMVKSAGLIEEILGFTSTNQIREAVEEAAADESVNQIVLQIDSPGGSVGGLAELADAVFAARDQKPVIAQVDGQAASAAFQVASQASQINMGREDMVGSIGVRLMLFDLSEAFANEGIEAVPIDTGEFKSAGALGTEITERQREDFQRIVDQFMDGFTDAIMRGRGMSEEAVQEVSDGRLFIGQEAVSLGLADEIKTLRETLSELSQQNRGQTARAKARLRLAQV